MDNIIILDGYEQKFKDESDWTWYTVFLSYISDKTESSNTEPTYLYCINYSVNERRFYGKTDRVVSGWRLKVDSFAQAMTQIEKSKKDDSKNTDSGRIVIIRNYSKDESQILWNQIRRYIERYLEAIDMSQGSLYLIDGTFEIQEDDKDQNDKKDPYALNIDHFRVLVSQ